MTMMMMIQVVSFFSIALIHSSSPSISRWLPFRVWSTLILFLSIPFRHRKNNSEGTEREAVQWWSHGNQCEPLRDLRVKTNETKIMMMTILRILSDVQKDARRESERDSKAERTVLKREKTVQWLQWQSRNFCSKSLSSCVLDLEVLHLLHSLLFFL